MPEAKPEPRLKPFFDLVGGNVSLDFVNTLDDRPSGKPKELLRDYYALARFGEDSGIFTPDQLDYFYLEVFPRPDEAEAAMRQARSLREVLYEIFWALIHKQTVPKMALVRFNGHLREATLHSHLVQVNGGFEWRFDDLKSSFQGILWPITRAAADLLTSSDVQFLRACSSPTCQWLFLDTSKNHHRRWCSMKLCGNRTKVRNFYARKKVE